MQRDGHRDGRERQAEKTTDKQERKAGQYIGQGCPTPALQNRNPVGFPTSAHLIQMNR